MPTCACFWIPLWQAKANLYELAAQVKARAERIITKNGESDVAIIHTERLNDDYQRERKHIYRLLIDDARKGLTAVATGKVKNAHSTLNAIKHRRAAKGTG